MNAWKSEVHAAILARAKELTDMPAGVQTVAFRIGHNGEIAMAKPVEPIENNELAKKLVDFLGSTGAVAKPPVGGCDLGPGEISLLTNIGSGPEADVRVQGVNFNLASTSRQIVMICNVVRPDLLARGGVHA